MATVVKSDEEWRAQLTPATFKVLRKKATEPRGVTLAKGGFDDMYDEGTWVCAGCGAALYTHEMKFDCGCGWPGFKANIAGAVREETDADGSRCEVLCKACDGHLGHVFRGERMTPENERHCVNSCSLAFIPEGKTAEDAIRCTYSGSVYGGD